MKTRVVLDEDGKFRVQYKTFLFWHTDAVEHYYAGSGYKIIACHDSEHQATLRMIQMVQEHEIKVAKKRASGVVREFSSEELREKFAEHFI